MTAFQRWAALAVGEVVFGETLILERWDKDGSLKRFNGRRKRCHLVNKASTVLKSLCFQGQQRMS
jgi:hypothetical protein